MQTSSFPCLASPGPKASALSWSTPFRSATELTQSLARLGKDFNALQLSQGQLQGRISVVHLLGISLLEIQTNQLLLLNGERGDDCTAFALESSNTIDDHKVHGKPINPNSLHGFKSGLNESFFSLTAGSTSYMVVTSTTRFHRYLMHCGQEHLVELLGRCNGVTLNQDHHRALCRIIATLFNAPTTRAADRQLNSSLLQTCLLNGLVESQADEYVTHQPKARHDLIRELVHWGFQNGHQPLNLDDVSRALYTSRRTLILGSKESTGMGPMELLRSIRLEQVNWMLRSPATRAASKLHSISEVAQHFGFRSRGNFAAIYRQHFEESPRDTLLAAA